MEYTLNALADEFERDAAGIRTRASLAVRKTAFDVIATAQQRVPVDTGATKNSINATMTPDGLIADVGPTTHYAGYLEYGTARMQPRPYMVPALDKHTPEFVAALRRVVGP